MVCVTYQTACLRYLCIKARYMPDGAIYEPVNLACIILKSCGSLRCSCQLLQKNNFRDFSSCEYELRGLYARSAGLKRRAISGSFYQAIYVCGTVLCTVHNDCIIPLEDDIVVVYTPSYEYWESVYHNIFKVSKG